MPRKKKIFIACGGSAGHIFPGLTLAEEMAMDYGDDVEISFLTTDNDLGKSLLKESSFRFHTLPVKGWGSRSFRGAVRFASGLIKGSLRSIKIIYAGKPDCFVGFGAYVAGPPFVASALLGVPTLIHEQNVSMGKANRIMRAFATKVALSFPAECGVKGSKSVVTGNPIRGSAARIRDRRVSRDLLELDDDKFTLLIMGGSQGSERINAIVLDMLKNTDRETKDKLQVIHMAGRKYYESVKNRYKEVGVLHRVYSFFEGMGVIYSAADVAISRAGSSAIFELCMHRTPSVLIPYPFAEGHQVRNASFLKEKGASFMIEEEGLSEESMRAKILQLMEDGGLRESMKNSMAGLAKPDAAKRLSLEVGRLAGLPESLKR